jgi:hypothetical protein
MAQILAQRQQEMEALQSEFRRTHSDSEHAAHRAAMLERIRSFFGLH